MSHFLQFKILLDFLIPHLSFIIIMTKLINNKILINKNYFFLLLIIIKYI